LVVGCGAIGGVSSGYLSAAGTPVWVLTTNQAIARAVRGQGLRVRGDAGRTRVQPKGVLERPSEAPGPFDFVLLAVQPPQLEEAAVQVEPLVAETGRVVCFQNGLCEERLAARFGRELMGRRFARRLGLEIVTEVVSVARAEGVLLEKVAGTLDLEWLALSEHERQTRGSPSLAAKHALIFAVATRFRRLRSSMLAAIERGRPPAVDFLNGEVLSRAEKHDLPAPINGRARDLVWAIARGDSRPSISTLRALYDATR